MWERRKSVVCGEASIHGSRERKEYDVRALASCILLLVYRRLILVEPVDPAYQIVLSKNTAPVIVQ